MDWNLLLIAEPVHRVKRTTLTLLALTAGMLWPNMAFAGSATQLLIAAGNNQIATAGTYVPGVVCVIVKDASNNPVGGVVVTWGSVTGGGTISGAVQTTDGSGIATLTRWSLGTVAGPNSITATSPGLPSVTFMATGVPGPATQMAIASGNNQTAVAGTAVANVVCVIIKDANLNGVPGVSVTWSGATNGGSITGATQSTAANGIATLGSWILGPSAGMNALTATSQGLPPVTFTATGVPGTPSQLAIAAGNNQSAPVGVAVPGPVCVIARDANNNPVSGVNITWGAITGGGSLSGATQQTLANGIATLGGWTLGPLAGTNTITASAAGSPSLLFTATALQPAQLTVVSGDKQTVSVGVPVSGALSVIVRDTSNNPLPGVTVTWGSVTGGGSISGGKQTTDAAGIATLGSWTLGAAPGMNTVTASAAGLPAVTFTANGVAPTQLAIVTGDNQTAVVGTAVSGVVCVVVKDANNLPVPGVPVTWGSVTGGGSLTGVTQITDGSGVATLGGWTLGSAPGPNTVIATSPGLPSVTFSAIAAAPTQMSIVSGDNQTAVIGTPVTTVVCVIIRDANNNPVPGLKVTWGSVSGGGMIGGAVQTTDLVGTATLGSWVLGAAPGINTIVASSATLPSVTFTATGVVGPPAQFVSAPVTPPPGIAGQPVTLFAASTPSSTAVLTWDLGDGTTATGSTVTHIYAAPGVYPVKVTLTDGPNVLTEFTNVAVNAAAPDLSGGNGKVFNVFAVQKGTLKFDFAKSGKDQMTLSGAIPVPANFSPAGKNVTIAIGALLVSSTLNTKGISADKSFVMKGKAKNGVFQESPAIFTFTQKFKALFDKLQQFGFGNGNVGKDGPQISVPVLVSIDAVSYVATPRFIYTAKAKKSGTGKITK